MNVSNVPVSSDNLRYGNFDRLKIKKTNLLATSNVVDLNLPGTSGTLALAPASGSYVDTVTNQTIGGIKRFTGNVMMTESGNDRIILDPVDGIGVFTASSSAAVPSLQIGATNKGFYDVGGNTIGVTAGGTQRFAFGSLSHTSTVRIQGPTGFNSDVTFGTGSATDGLYFNTTNNATAVANGSSGTPTDVLYCIGTRSPQTLQPGVSNRVTGSNSNPSHRFSDTNGGWYSAGSNLWGYGVSGTTVLTIGSSGITLGTSQVVSGYLNTNGTWFVDNSDTTKQFKFDVSGSGTGLTTTIQSATATSSKTLTLPNQNTTLVGRSGTETLTGAKTFTGGFKIGANGTNNLIVLEGSVTTSTVITSGSNATIANIDISGASFSATPSSIQITLMHPSGGANWDRTLVAVDAGGTSSTNIRVTGVNTSAGSTSGTATIYYRAMA